MAYADAVVAAYASGEAVESIAGRFGVGTAAVEAIVARATAAAAEPVPAFRQGPPAGWYADPAGASAQRWWDGQEWTDFLQPAPAVVPPAPPVVPPPHVVTPPNPAPGLYGSPKSKGRHTGRRRYRLLAHLAVLGAVVGGLGYHVFREHEKDLGRPARAQAAALVACHKNLEYSLTSPATARYSGETVFFADADPGKFTVFGSVDSQNGFGAVLRSTYVCDGHLAGDQESVPAAFAGINNDAYDDDGPFWQAAEQGGHYRDRLPVCGLNQLGACFD